jgi:hypothetical protein
MAECPEGVALALLERIADAEDWHGMGKVHPERMGRPWLKTRTEILDVYRECLRAVKAGAGP